jgi:multidrug resistance efflux pump
VLGGGGLLLLVLLLLPIAQFRVSADAALEGRVQRAAAVPFSGFIARSNARAGDIVQAGEVLAVLDDRDLRLEHARSIGEVSQLDRQYRQALAQHERSEMNLYGAQLRQAEAELRLIEYKLARVNIVAPIGGVLVSGDVSQLVGSPVEEGEVMFEVAPLGDFRVALQVEEGDISYLEPGQEGRFAPTGLAGRTVPFTVTKLTSVTANEDGKNVFRVEAELGQGAPDTLRPGMEGIAKVEIDRRSQLWIWTRGLRDWFSLFLWKWLP